MNDLKLDPAAPGAVPHAPLPRALWVGAGAVALTIAGIASALAWRGSPPEAPNEPAPVATAEPVPPLPAASPRPARPAPERAAAAPSCMGCGVVVAVQAVQQPGQGTGVGAVAGGVVGGLLGNQVGTPVDAVARQHDPEPVQDPAPGRRHLLPPLAQAQCRLPPSLQHCWPAGVSRPRGSRWTLC